MKKKHTPFTFGKYKGRTPKEVSRFDASYVVWAAETVEHFNIGSTFLTKCRALAGEQWNSRPTTQYDGGSPFVDQDYDELDWDPLWLEAGIF